MVSRVVSIALVVSAFLLWTLEAWSDDAQQGRLVFERLRQHGLIEDYFVDSVGEIAGTVVDAAGVWPGYRINQPYAPGLINVYLIDSRRLPATNILEDQGIDFALGSVRGNAIAHENTGIVFVDTWLLKSLVAAAVLLTNADVDTVRTVASIEAGGIDLFRQIWDPGLNPALLESEYTDQWVLLASGAAALILAHEIGHIYIGEDDRKLRRTRMPIKGKEDADIRWACSDLVGAEAQRMQGIERKVDDYAVSLLGKILFPPGVLTQPMLRYELGAHWYIVFSLASQVVKALAKTESQNIRNALAAMVGADIVAQLVAASNERREGSIQVFFPKTHPANIRRAAVSLNKLAYSPHSIYRGTPPSTANDIALMENLISLECANLKARQGR